MLKSKALEVNLAHTQVEVVVDPKYACLQEVMAGYYGLLDRLGIFLREVSHPYKNWQYIVDNCRGFSLDYFHLFKDHPKGPEAVSRLINLFCGALESDTEHQVQVDAADNLILYLQKIITSSEDALERFYPVVAKTFDIIQQLPDPTFEHFVRSFYGMKRLAQSLLDAAGSDKFNYQAINRLLARYYTTTYDYWLSEVDPLQRFLAKAEISFSSKELEAIFDPISHKTMKSQRSELQKRSAESQWRSLPLLKAMLTLVDHHHIAKSYRCIPDQLMELGSQKDRGHYWKAIFLFQAMNTPGLANDHEDILREINRTISWLIANWKPRHVHNLIQKTFSILNAHTDRFPSTTVTCVDTMGREIFQTGNRELINYFIDAVIDLGFQAPKIRGVGNDWQIQANSAHLKNIRTWMNLIRLQPEKSTRLLSNLIIHLAVSGVFIKDTDLFGRDITHFFNSPIGPVYNLCKQLARLFPVYFNDIGAEGELRDVSTRLDEICHRRDPLIHFLRKQSHVESSNRIIGFMDAVLHFWAKRDKTHLASYMPPDIYNGIESEGAYIDGVHAIVTGLEASGVALPTDLLSAPASKLKGIIGKTRGVTDIDRERIVLFAELYKQLNNKYNLNFINLMPYFHSLRPETFPELHKLDEALGESNLKSRIFKLLDYLERLKSIILSPEHFEISENIYKKRHFTVDIPSMYGSYNEKKFDAMGLTLRLEALANVLLEELIHNVDLSLVTKATCYQIYDCLMLLDKALKIDGIDSAELEHHLDLLVHSMEIKGFSFTQYLDIFKGLSQAVKNIIQDYFNNIHGKHLTRILSRLPSDQIQNKFHPVNGSADPDKLRHRVSEIFLRDRLAMSLGLQQLDLFLTRILNTLYHQSSKLPEGHLRRLLNYDPKRTVTSLADPNNLATGIIYLGNKGQNMMRLHNFGFPVPPGFIITTEVFRCWDIIESFQPAKANFEEQLIRHIGKLEAITGKKFGSPAKPLILSVRSGSSISQPGMMETFLDVGMNEAIAHGLSRYYKNEWFAWDSFRRFLQCFGMALGIQRNDFDDIIAGFKRQWGIPLKREFSGKQMQQVAVAYKHHIEDQGHQVPDKPFDQLLATIQAVIASWDSAKAKSYRKIMGISDDWGTAITVQAMVFGNLSTNSGSGVVFTHNPRWTGVSADLWGDFTLGNQGEDVVSGLVSTLPISIRQQEMEMRETDITLETAYPRIYQTMRHISQTLISEKGWAPQEIEFTFEGPAADQLYLLQTRDMAIRERQEVFAFDPSEQEASVYLGHGIGVGGGAMSGRLVFTLGEVEHWRKAEPRTHLILARGDTVPDDIQEIHAADGLVTAKGGVTSHAAVVAHRLGKTCVVGCGNLICDETARTITFTQQRLVSGDFVSIDGREGSVYKGKVKIKRSRRLKPSP
ncbi:MAG: PEP/pyruvate-binding domain-containing protein [Desulfobacteraceae bacterium]